MFTQGADCAAKISYRCSPDVARLDDPVDQCASSKEKCAGRVAAGDVRSSRSGARDYWFSSLSAASEVNIPRGLQVTGRPVVVKLNTGVDYRGVLACLDGYMNIAMEQVSFSALSHCSMSSKCRHVQRHAMCEIRPYHTLLTDCDGNYCVLFPDGGVCERSTQEQVRRCFYPRQ